MSNDLDSPSCGFLKEVIQHTDKGTRAKACCVEVLSICEVKVAVE